VALIFAPSARGKDDPFDFAQGHPERAKASRRMKKRIKIQGLLMSCGLVIIILFYRYFLALPQESTLRNFIDIAGIFLILSGYLLRISSRGVKAELNPDGKTLVQKGPYALTRNPMYLGTLIIGIGFTAVLFRWWVSVTFLIIYLAIYIPQIKREENKLNSFFGETFKEYCRKTPRFVPALRQLFSRSPKVYLQIKKSWIKKELPSLVITIILITIIKILIHLQS
jgi:protein-S-isoprenylcysteine O-methyltransferase Ste14